MFCMLSFIMEEDTMKRNLSRLIALFLIVTFLIPYTVYCRA